MILIVLFSCCCY